ncbi:cytochrome P450 [Streptomyces sp. NPDC127106]|uniref:cytochrome P450 n=1 Tax=Streptomyces sp. NPDC127106 TaxID=3345360 RepID=UPI003641DD0D
MTDPTAEPHYPMDRQCPYAPPREATAVREAGTVPRVTLWNGVRPWLFTRFDDARTVLSDPRFSADKSRPGYPLSSAVALAETAVEPTLLVMDNPQHDAVRRLVLGEFTVKRAERWRPAVRAVADDCIDRMLQGTEADLVADLALPVALTVICEFLGVPVEDRDLFRTLTHTMNVVAGSTESAATARQTLQDYLEDLVADHERHPQDGFIGRMAARHLPDGTMTRRQLAAMALLLLTAGHDTTANMISLGVLTLLRHPRSFAALNTAGENTRIAADTVEELLRHLSVVQRGIRRIAVEDVPVGDRLVRAGEGAIAAINVANRDPERFPSGEEFDPAARAHGHLAFGYGPHQCMGQSLARVELQEVYAAVARRIPTLRTAVPEEELRFKSDMAVYGLHALPVTW